VDLLVGTATLLLSPKFAQTCWRGHHLHWKTEVILCCSSQHFRTSLSAECGNKASKLSPPLKSARAASLLAGQFFGEQSKLIEKSAFPSLARAFDE